MGAQNNPAYRPWSKAEDQYILERPSVSHRQLGAELNRSPKAVNNRRLRLKKGITVGRRIRTAKAIEKFNATMEAKRAETRAGIEIRSHKGWPEPDAVTWDQLLKGRTFGTPRKVGTAVKLLRVSYSGASMVGCAAAMCSEVA